ncbi:MAG: hypothetical protein ACYTAF_10845 [Planctomycetota bacterium]|jgi:hypothetical protein
MIRKVLTVLLPVLAVSAVGAGLVKRSSGSDEAAEPEIVQVCAAERPILSPCPVARPEALEKPEHETAVKAAPVDPPEETPLEYQPPYPEGERPEVRYLQNLDRAHRMLLEAGARWDVPTAEALAYAIEEILDNFVWLYRCSPVDVLEDMRCRQMELGTETDPDERRWLKKEISRLKYMMTVAKRMEHSGLQDEIEKKMEWASSVAWHYAEALDVSEGEDVPSQLVSGLRATYIKAYTSMRESLRQELE